MIVTVETARKKWCSFMKLDNYYGHYNDPHCSSKSTNCIASDCMAWIWHGDDKGYCGRNYKPN
jgi:hypothetical protein